MHFVSHSASSHDPPYEHASDLLPELGQAKEKIKKHARKVANEMTENAKRNALYRNSQKCKLDLNQVD